MLALLLLNRMNTDRRARQQRPAKVPKNEAKSPQVYYCRTCLATDDLVSIFYNKETEQKMSHDLRLVTGLEIKMDDGLSQKICTRCIETMNMALHFRRTSRKSEKALINMISGKRLKNYSSRHQRQLKPPAGTSEVQKVEMEDYSYDIYGDQFQDQEEDCLDSQPKIMEKQTKKKQIITNCSPYKCTSCGKEFRMKATYKAHLRFHTNYCVCETCGKRCRNNNQLQEHKRARHGLYKIHKCAYCEYSSATKEALTIHERRHTGERPYVCDHCGATFHRRSNLVQHIAIHLPEKNFQCDMCPKRLKSRKFLQIHKHNAHTGKRYGYLCGICEHRFEKPNKVRAHTRRVHGIPDDQQGPIVRCVICSKWEKSKKRLQVHIYKVHKEHRYRYLCPQCPKTYKCPDHVRRHLVNFHNLPRSEQGPVQKLIVNA